MTEELTPFRLEAAGRAFMQSRVLITAVEFGLFTLLGKGAKTAGEIEDALRLHPRATLDFLDVLVAMKILERDGDGPTAEYRNGRESAAFLDESSPRYMGGRLVLYSERVYGFWTDLPEALRTGEAQNETKGGGKSLFEALYETPARLEGFVRAMSGNSAGRFDALAQRFDFSPYNSLCDVGGSAALLSICVAKQNPHLRCMSFDLAMIEPIAKRAIAQAGLADRVVTRVGDFFSEPLPKADVITMGMILHDWDLQKKMHLVRAAYEALPKGGAFIVVENLIDDERRENTEGLIMSLQMLIETGSGFDYSAADFRAWCDEAGFERVEVLPLVETATAAIAFK
jgi:hypothetical protein